MGADGAARLDFEAIETTAKGLALHIMGQALAARVNSDHSDYQGPHKPCGCGGQALYAGRRSKTFTTALGEMELGARLVSLFPLPGRASVRATKPWV